MVTRLLLLTVVTFAGLVGCASPPVPPTGPMPTVTTTDVPPIRHTYQTCDEARQAWDRGEISESSLIDGAVVIVHEDGITEFCEVGRPTRGRFIQP